MSVWILKHGTCKGINWDKETTLKKFLPTISSGSTFVFADTEFLSGMHGRVELVVIVAWQRFNIHISLITILASNISRVSSKNCGDDRSWQQYCGLLLYGSCHIWIPFPRPLSTSHESASGPRLKAYGRIQPTEGLSESPAKPLSNTDNQLSSSKENCM